MLLQKKPFRSGLRKRPAEASQSDATTRRSPVRTRHWIFAGVGAVLVLLSLRAPLLLFAGAEVDATITAIQRIPGTTENPFPSLAINYAFTDAEGVARSGSSTRPVSLPRETNPEPDDTVRVRYVREASWMHSADSAEEIAVLSTVLFLCGAGLCVLGARRVHL